MLFSKLFFLTGWPQLSNDIKCFSPILLHITQWVYPNLFNCILTVGYKVSNFYYYK